MLHELLFALSGHYGGLFKDTGDGIKVVKGLPFIHQAEEELLDRLCILGTYYHKFTKFIKKHTVILALQYDQDKTDIHGLYLKCFCLGLEDELNSYQNKLGSLEQDVLRDQHLGVPHFICELNEYFLLFPAIDSVIEQIETQKAHGCYILEIIHKNSGNGLPLVKTVLQRILKRCHRVMYKHLCSWMLNGRLTDRYQEFFIQEATENVPVSVEDSRDEYANMGLLSQQLQQMELDQSIVSLGSGSFVLRADLLPSYIPARVANRILFIGESIQVFELQRRDDPSRQGPIPADVQRKFSNMLLALSELDHFSLMRFEDTMEEIRIYVSERLWHLIVEEHQLVNQLKVIKDFYLLGRGELYLAFIDQAEDFLRRPPSATTEHDVNAMFLEAASSVLISNEALLQRFHFAVSQKLGVTKDKSRKPSNRSELGEDDEAVDLGWKSLFLKYTVEKPIHILLTDTALERYNTVLQFLLAVKRAQLKLQKCWLLQMQGRKTQIAPEERLKWQLRTHMAFLVDNLQYFLQVDVIESLFSVLVRKINTTRDFEDLKLAHDQFVAGLLAQTFVHIKPVWCCLNKLLGLCSTFCRLLHSCGEVMTKVQVKSMDSVSKTFQWHSNQLFKHLTSIRDNSASPQLTQLLLRLDYNNYFTSSGGQLGRTDFHRSYLVLPHRDDLLKTPSKPPHPVTLY